MKNFVAASIFCAALTLLCGVRAGLAAPTNVVNPKPELVLQSGNTLPAISLRFSPDNTIAASCTQKLDTAISGGTLKTWNTLTGELIRTWSNVPASVCDTAFSPDGKSLLLASGEKGISLWDIASGRKMGQLESTEPCGSVCLSPDGRFVVAASGSGFRLLGKVFIWDRRTHRLLRTLSGEKNREFSHTSVCVSQNMGITQDGKRIWLRTAHHLTWWQLDSGYKVSDEQFDVNDSVIPSPDGSSIAIVPDFGSPYAKGAALLLRKSFTPEILWKWLPRNADSHWKDTVGFSPNGQFVVVATSEDSRYHLLDARSGVEIKSWVAGTAGTEVGDKVALLSFSSDSKQLGVGTSELGLVYFLSLAGLPGHTPIAEPPNDIEGFDVSRDGHTLAWLQNDMLLVLWNLVSGRRTKAIQLQPESDDSSGDIEGPADFQSMELSPEGEVVYVQSRDELRAYDTRTGKKLWSHTVAATLKPQVPGAKNAQPEFVALSLSGDGKLLASILSDGPLRLWNARTGAWLNTHAGDEPQFTFTDSILLSQNGRKIAVSSVKEPYSSKKTTSLQLLETNSLHSIQKFIKATGKPTEFSPDGQTLLVSEQPRGLSAYDVDSGHQIWKLPKTSSGSFETNQTILCLDSDGWFRERDTKNARVIRAWNSEEIPVEGSDIRVLPHHSAIGRTNDATLSVWDTAKGKKLVTLAIPALPDRSSPHWIAYTPDNFYTGSPGIEKFLRWRTGLKLESGAKWRSRFYNPAKVAAALSSKPLVQKKADMRRKFR